MAFSHPIFADNLFTKLRSDHFFNLTHPYFAPQLVIYMQTKHKIKKKLGDLYSTHELKHW